MPDQIKNGNALTFLKNYWFIILFIISISFGWATLEARINDLTQDRFYGRDGLILEGKIEQNEANIQRIDTSLLRIESKIDKLIENGTK